MSNDTVSAVTDEAGPVDATPGEGGSPEVARPAPADAKPDTPPAISDDASVAAAAAPLEKPAAVPETTGLPPLEQQPPLPGASPEDGAARMSGEGDAARRFAEEEGLASDAERPRRDLGEFEDDETVLEAAEPSQAPPAEHYRDPHEYAEPAQTGASFGALAAAAALGGVVALVLGALLAYSGMLPGSRQPAADQYASAGEVQQLRGDLGTLREGVEQIQSTQAAGGAGDGGASAADLAALSDRVAGIENAGPGPAAAPSVDPAAVEAAQSAADQAGQQAAAATQRVDELTTRLDAVEAANREAATALAAAGLKAAIDRGGPFMPELETFAERTGGDPAVDALRDYAAAGVPTRAELVTAWPDAEKAILAALRAPEAGSAVGEQMLSGLRSLVTVRPTEGAPASAEGPEAAVSRLAADLQSGDLASWRSEWEALPEAAKQASAEFAADVEARRQATQIVDEALTRASSAAAGSQEG